MSNAILNQIATDLGLLPSHLAEIVRTAPLRYKKFQIPKRNGGVRKIAQPARELKALQYWVLERVLSPLPVHEAAAAYRKGSSIQGNVARHVRSNFILKMDFANFFPSILASDFVSHLSRHQPERFSIQDMDVLSRILFWVPNRTPPLELCIGAPSSPFISNTIMFEFDSILKSRVEPMGIVYSRYADDLTFSTADSGILQSVAAIVQEILDEISYPRLLINIGKTVHASRAKRRTVTGLIITPEGNISVGRDRKKLIRAMFYEASKGGMAAKELEKLRGYIAFVDGIEPGFSKTLRSRK